MSVSIFVKLFETVGIPVLAAAAAGYALWWLIRWITTSLKKDLANEHKDTINEIRETKQELLIELTDTKKSLEKQGYNIQTILVRLVDRIRTLELNFVEHDETVRALYGLTRANRRRTRHETVEDLQEQIKVAGKTNGDE